MIYSCSCKYPEVSPRPRWSPRRFDPRYACICVYLVICLRTCSYTLLCIPVVSLARASERACVCVGLYLSLSLSLSLYIYMYIYTYLSIYVCMCIYIYIYIYIYITLCTPPAGAAGLHGHQLPAAAVRALPPGP